jgi:hypothetical protein
VSYTRQICTGDVKDFVRAGHVFGLVVKFLDFGVRREEMWKVRDRKGNEVKEGSNEKGGDEVKKKDEQRKGIWEKIKDSTDLWIFTNRGIGWNWAVRGIPPRAPQSKP